MPYDDIQDSIDEGLGFAAEELGVPHDVYRISGTSSGNYLDPGNKIASSVLALTKIAYGAGVRESFETERTQGILWYRVIADLRNFKVGDVFVVNDPVYGQGASSVNFASTDFKGFALADRSPMKKALAGRINTLITIERPTVAPSSSGTWDNTTSGGAPIVLQNGAFSVGSIGAQAAKIPAGLIATGKSYGGATVAGIPGAERKSGWELYLPALNGFIVHEGDVVIGPDNARYKVIVPYTQYVGASGSQWFLEREAAGN